MAKWARVHSKKAKRLYFVEPIAKRADAKGSMLAATAIATHWLSSFPFSWVRMAETNPKFGRFTGVITKFQDDSSLAHRLGAFWFTAFWSG